MVRAKRSHPGGLVIVVMGVAGCGKTTVGKRLSAVLGFDFFDADDFHPVENVAKMHAGIALTDADRTPWIDRLNDLIRKHALERGGRMVLACSALKVAYRMRLVAGCADDCRFVHLSGDKATMAARLAARAGHYMNPALLDSQFAIL
ncbi:MAG: gluconokinase, GntK/IdnK-type, partial [Burkholderiales bacterium]